MKALDKVLIHNNYRHYYDKFHFIEAKENFYMKKRKKTGQERRTVSKFTPLQKKTFNRI